MNLETMSSGELKSLASDMHNTFGSVDADTFGDDDYYYDLGQIIKELLKRGYTIHRHVTLVFDK